MAEGILSQFRNGALNIFFKVPLYDPIAWVNLEIISYYQYGKTDSLELQRVQYWQSEALSLFTLTLFLSAQNVYTY